MKLVNDRRGAPEDRPGGAPRPRKRRGAAAAEFAVLAPVLFAILLGTLEMGRAMMAKSLLNDAARKACRTAILPNGANSAITAEVANILADNGLNIANATVTIQVNGKTADASTAKQNDSVSVKVAMPFSRVAWTTPFFLTNTTVESEFVVMMRQG
jgi:Flp pilus assembly protein TadG